MSRRQVLLGSSALITAALAGCSSDETDAGTGTRGDGAGGGSETLVDETVTGRANYSVDAAKRDVIHVDVSVREGNASVRVVNVDGTDEPIYRKDVEHDASFDVAIDDPGAYEIRAVTAGRADVHAEIIRAS